MVRHFKELILKGHHLDLLSIALEKEFDQVKSDTGEGYLKKNYVDLNKSIDGHAQSLSEVEKAIGRSINYLRSMNELSKKPEETVHSEQATRLIKLLVKTKAKKTLHQGYIEAWEKEDNPRYKEIADSIFKGEVERWKNLKTKKNFGLEGTGRKILRKSAREEELLRELKRTKKKLKPTQKKLVEKFIKENKLHEINPKLL